MKIKADFITNSSSTMYIIEFREKFLRKNLEKHVRLRTGEYFKTFTDKMKLIKYTQQEDVDWITKATQRPFKYWGLDKGEFDAAMTILESGNYAVYLRLDRNTYERRDDIEVIIIDNGGIIRHTGSD